MSFDRALSDKLVVPVRLPCGDDPMELIARAIEWRGQGREVALATLVEIRGGAARALGAQMIVRADGIYSGYVSGGCTEAAVAAEAVVAIGNGSDRFLRLGEGSPFFDIILPCGGGITLAVHLLRDTGPLTTLMERVVGQRRKTSVIYDPGTQSLECRPTPISTGWHENRFAITYRPKLRLLLAGSAQEIEVCAKIGRAADYDVSVVSEKGQMCWHFDADTALVLLYHDLNRELPLLRAALASRCFYIGALGSAKTHSRRIKALQDLGVDPEQINRIRAPIGLIPKARDASTLAISIIAQTAATYMIQKQIEL